MELKCSFSTSVALIFASNNASYFWATSHSRTSIFIFILCNFSHNSLCSNSTSHILVCIVPNSLYSSSKACSTILTLKFISLEYKSGNVWTCPLHLPCLHTFVWNGSYDAIWTTMSKFTSICFQPFLGFHPWLHLCLNLIEVLAHVNKWNFLSWASNNSIYD